MTSEAGAASEQQWSITTAPPSLLYPSPTTTQASGTSSPKTSTFDMELNSTRTQSLFSADSDHGDGSNARVCPKTGRKRLKLRHDEGGDGAVMVDRLNAETRVQNMRQKDEEEEAVAQAAASLVSLSSNDDDGSLTGLRQNVSSSSLAVIGEGSSPVMGKGSEWKHGHHWSGSVVGEGSKNGKGESLLAVIGEGSEGEHGSVVGAGPHGGGSVVGDGSGDGCSSESFSVLSRPSNKRRYRLVVDVLAESPRVMVGCPQTP